MKRNGDWITTYTGLKFYAFDPQIEDIHIEDIAHALSLICRYNGHCKFFYSVAQHSIGVREILLTQGYNHQIQLYGLLHDASEAYICDIPRNIKHNMPEYKAIESSIQNIIWTAFELPEPTKEIHDIIKKADNMMLKCEAKVLMKNWQEWNLPYDDIKISIDNKNMDVVRCDFEKTFEYMKFGYI